MFNFYITVNLPISSCYWFPISFNYSGRTYSAYFNLSKYIETYFMALHRIYSEDYPMCAWEEMCILLLLDSALYKSVRSSWIIVLFKRFMPLIFFLVILPIIESGVLSPQTLLSNFLSFQFCHFLLPVFGSVVRCMFIIVCLAEGLTLFLL